MDLSNPAELAKLPWVCNRETFDAKAKELGVWVKALFGNAGFTTYLHILIAHCGYLIERGYDFARFANFDIEGKHLVLKKTTKGVTGKKDYARHALQADIITRKAGPKRTSRSGKRRSNDEEARQALNGAGKMVGKKASAHRGRKPKAGKQPLHTMRK